MIRLPVKAKTVFGSPVAMRSQMSSDCRMRAEIYADPLYSSLLTNAQSEKIYPQWLATASLQSDPSSIGAD